MESNTNRNRDVRRSVLFRARAEDLRRLAQRPEKSSVSDALLAAAREWDALAEGAPTSESGDTQA